jgi:predicted signal transduction protein with EAL and GGDEF domain
LRVAVNLSPLQFANSALPAIVTSALASAQVAPSRLELEITESVFLSEDSSTEAMFAALKRIGVRLALDDFGTGYSSLGYLEAAPFDRIKLDREFLRGAIEPGSRNGAIFASIVGLAEALGMETTAEGVETPEELELARILGCSHVQGFVYEAPMSLRDTVSRLARGLDARAGGVRTLRSPRNASLRQVVIEIGGERHDAVVCDVAIGGATVELSTHLPAGTAIAVHVGEGEAVPATVCWCDEGRLGVEFAAPLTVATPRRMQAGGIASASIGDAPEIRRAG